MKKIFVVIVFIFPLITLSQIRSGKIVYGIILPEFDYQAAAKTSSGSMLIEALKKVTEASKYQKYELKFDTKYSQFTKVPLMVFDPNLFDEFAVTSVNGTAVSNADYFFDVEKSRTIYKKNNVLVESPKVVWKVLQESKNIENYNCLKAIGEYQAAGKNGVIMTKKVEAWFAPKIAIQFGPKNFNSLPGLVLELRELGSGIVFKVETIDLSSDEKDKIIYPEGEVVSHVDYSKQFLK